MGILRQILVYSGNPITICFKQKMDFMCLETVEALPVILRLSQQCYQRVKSAVQGQVLLLGAPPAQMPHRSIS